MALDRTWWNNLVDDDGSNTVGTVWNKTQIKALLDSVDVALVGVSGPWVDVAYSAGNFSILAGSGTWTVASGHQLTFSYQRSGSVVLVNLALQGTTITGSPAILGIQWPAGLPSPRNYTRQAAVLYHTSGPAGQMTFDPGQTKLYIWRDSGGTPFPASTLNIAGLWVIPV